MKSETACSIAVQHQRGMRGFTLIELAIVLFIITLLLGGVLTPLGQQIAERQNGDSRRALEAARVALVGYALRHPGQAGPLPCPDLRSRVAGNDGLGQIPSQTNDGLEDRMADGACLSQAGNLPWKTLSLAEADAWGNRLGYAVSQEWSNPGRTRIDSSPTASGLGAASDPGALLAICSDRSCAVPLTAAALVISHGRNGFGAVNSNGGSNLAPTSADEVENSNGDNRFVMFPPRAADRPDGEFDDLLLPLSSDWLRGRLCDPASLCNGG